MKKRILLAGLLALSLAACTTSAGTSPSAAASAGPSTAAASPSTPAASPSSAAASPESVPLDVAVKWDGSKCTYLGPTVLPEGTLTRFAFTSTGPLMLVIVGVVPGTTWDTMVKDAAKGAMTGAPGWVIETGFANIPANSSALFTISRRVGVVGTGVTVGTLVGGYFVGCSEAKNADASLYVMHPAALLQVAED